MRNIIFFFLILVNFTYANAETKIVYIDIDYIITNSIVGKEINQHLSKIKNSKNDEFKIIEDDLKNKEKTVIAQKNIISEEKFKSEIISLNKEFKIYNNQRKKFAKSLEKKKIDLTKQIFKALNPIIADYVNKNDISLVLPKDSIIVGKKNLDISSFIIEDLNNKLKTININE